MVSMKTYTHVHELDEQGYMYVVIEVSEIMQNL